MVKKMNRNTALGIAAFIAIIAIALPPVSISIAQGQAGTTLSASVNASAIYLIEYVWDIYKEANATEVYLSSSNPTADVEYTVTATKTVNTSYYIEGYVTVKNGGGRSTENLAITIDVYAEPPWTNLIIDDYPVDTSLKPILGPGETYSYYYKVLLTGFESYNDFKVDANVTITNHSGSLGEPKGPSPDATTSKTVVVNGYDAVSVTDSNGRFWTTSESATWTYTMTFEYNPLLGNMYTHDNTATISETGQSSSVTITIYQEILQQNIEIGGIVFRDSDFNGAYGGGDVVISGVTVNLYWYDDETGEWSLVATAYSGDDGAYSFSVGEEGLYKVVVVPPEPSACCDVVINTTPIEYEFYATFEGSPFNDNDFGFVQLEQLTGARSKGYWSWSQYNRKTGQWLTRVTMDDVNYINGELNTSFSSPKELADYLTSPVYGDMSKALMQQLIATLLNLKYGYISGESVVYYNGEFLTINDITSYAKTALTNGNRCEQEYWKDLLNAINNNYVYIVCW